MGGDTHPHLPIFATAEQPRIEPTEPLVNASSDYHGGRLKRELCCDPFEPGREHACNLQLFRGASLKVAAFIRNYMPAKPRSDFRVLLKKGSHLLIKSICNPVVTVKQVDQTASRALETCIEVPAMANVL
jgi:hypothetical protein